MANIEQLELRVLDNAIHCQGCEARIERVVGRLPGVVKAKADHKTQKVNIALDTDKTPLKEVKEKLGAAGYQTG